MPQNTRVYRCVHKLKKKHGLGGAIGICQSATGQSYMTGKSFKKEKRVKRKTRKTRKNMNKKQMNNKRKTKKN